MLCANNNGYRFIYLSNRTIATPTANLIAGNVAYRDAINPVLTNGTNFIKDFTITRNIDQANYVFEFDFVINKTWTFISGATLNPNQCPGMVFLYTSTDLNGEDTL